MPAGEIGEILEDASCVRGRWQIPDFLALTEEMPEKSYLSPEFLFMGCRWRLKIYPNASSAKGWTGLFLETVNVHLPIVVECSIGFRNADGKTKHVRTTTLRYFSKLNSWGWIKYIEVSSLQSRKSELVPSSTLTVCYKLVSDDQYPLEGSLSRRYCNTSRMWDDILTKRKRTDVVLQLEDGDIPAHRMVLESSSAVFQRMFGVNMRERRTGKVRIEDATASAFQVALSFIYSGDPIGLSSENMFDVYSVAHKYEFDELRKFITIFMRESLCVDNFCRVIEFADLYGETALKESVLDYIAKNKADVFKTEEWKTFKTDNPVISFEVLECILEKDI